MVRQCRQKTCDRMKLNIYVPRNKEDSKCWRVFSPFMLGWDDETHIEHDYIEREGMAMFWGLVGQNSQMIDNIRGHYLFSDMGYFGRYNALQEAIDPSADFYWRICIDGMHNNILYHSHPPDRFEKFGIEVARKQKKGSEIIICPSSESVTMHHHNISVAQWLEIVTEQIRENSLRPYRIRHKPRKNGTSGPAVADVSFEEDIKDAYCVITAASMAGVEAIIHGVPVIETSVEGPVGNCHGKLFGKELHDLKWNRDEVMHRLSGLAYSQFNHEEMANGFAREVIQRV